MSTPGGGGEYAAYLSFGTDIQSVADIIAQASGQMEGSVSNLFRTVEQLGASTGFGNLALGAQDAVGRVAELQAALARLNAEQAQSFGLGAVLPASLKGQLSNETVAPFLRPGPQSRALQIPGGPTTRSGEALVPFDDGTVARVNLANNKILQSFASQGEALQFLVKRFAEYNAVIASATAGTEGEAAAASAAAESLGAQASATDKAAAATARLAATQRLLAEARATGQATPFGKYIQVPEGVSGLQAGFYSQAGKLESNPLAVQNEEARVAAANARANAKAQAEFEKANITPAARGLEELAQAGKYVFAYEAVFKVVEGIKEAVEATKLYQEGLLSLDIALASVNQNGAVTAKTLQGISSEGGISQGEGLQLAARGIQAFRSESGQSQATAQRVAIDSTTGAIQAQVLTGGKLVDVQGQLIAAAREFNLGSEGQTRVLDAATNAYRSFGGSIGTVLEGLSQVAGVGEEAGFSIEQTANLIGLITSSTNLSGSAAAGDLKRILGGAGSPAFQNALSSVGINTSGNTAQELTQLGEIYGTLNNAQKSQIETTLGGRRSAEALIPLLQNINLLQEANARSTDQAGAAQQEFDRRQETLAGTLRQVAGAFQDVLVSLGNSGVADGFGLALRAVTPLLQSLNLLLETFDKLPNAVRAPIGILTDLALVIKGLELVTGRSLVIGAGFGVKNVVGGAAAGTAPIAAAGDAAATEIAAAGSQVAAALSTVAGETLVAGGEAAGAEAVGARTTGGLGGLLAGGARLGPTVAAIAGVLAAVDLGGKAIGLQGAESRTQDLYKFGGGSEDAVRAQVSKVAAAEAELRDKSSGFTGTIANLLSGGGADAAIARLKKFKDELNQEVKELGGEQAKGGLTGRAAIFAGGFQDPQTFTNQIKVAQAQGYQAGPIASAIVEEITREFGTAQRQATAGLPAGSVSLTGQSGKQFADTLFGSVIPSSFRDQRPIPAQLAVDSKLGRPQVGFVGRGAVVYADNPEPTTLDGDSRGKIRASLNKLIGDRSALGPADLDAVATAVAESYGLLAPDAKAALKAQVLAKLKGLASSQASGTNLTKAFAASPELVGTVATSLAQQQAQALSDAQARGASTSQLQSVSTAQLRALQNVAQSAKGAGIDNQVTQEQLPQLIAAARKTAFDNFQARINELLTTESAGKTDSQANSLRQQAARILTSANRTDPNLLPQGFTSLTQAQAGLTNKALAGASAALSAADANYRSVIADVLLLQQQADALDAAARAAFAAGDYSIAAAAYNAASGSRARAKANDPRLPVLGLNDAGAQAGITASGAKAAASSAGDTAEQVRAAAFAANQFSTSKYGQAQAALRTAKADLDAQKRGTVAYYNALKGYRDAQYQLAETVTQERAIARQLREDSTNPLVKAREELLSASQQLALDRSRKAPKDVLQQDELAVRLASQNVQSTAFEQNLNAVKTNYELQRISESQYLAYLNKQHDVLSRIAHRTYQQGQELNEVDQLLQQAASALQGQFNIGDIKLPTIYEVRRAVAIQAGGGSGGTVINTRVDVTVNPADQQSTNRALAQIGAAVGVDALRTGTTRRRLP